MTASNHSSRALVVVLTTAMFALLAVGSVGPAAGQTAPADDEPAFVVDLHADGSATVEVTYTFDLDETDEQAAFEDLRDEQQARDDLRDRFENRMQDVATAGNVATDREMSVSNTAIEIERAGSTGIVTVSLSWSGLASVEEGQLTVTEPFASGFEPDRTFVVQLPDGYDVVSVTPEPDRQEEYSLVWTTGADLSGFELTVADEQRDTEQSDALQTNGEQNGSDADDNGTGFGLAVAAVSLIALAVFALRRK